MLGTVEAREHKSFSNHKPSQSLHPSEKDFHSLAKRKSLSTTIIQPSQRVLPTKKIYIAEKNLRIKGKSFLLRSKKNIWQAKGVHTDDRGIYVFREDCVRLSRRDWDTDEGEGEQRYMCSACGKKYYTYNSCDAHIWGRHGGFGHVIER
jgi:hypothetical protein